jgi:hypothetical protein
VSRSDSDSLPDCHTVEAEYQGNVAGKIKLKKPNGKVVTVPPRKAQRRRSRVHPQRATVDQGTFTTLPIPPGFAFHLGHGAAPGIMMPIRRAFQQTGVANMAFDLGETIDAEVREFVKRKSPGFDASRAVVAAELPQPQEVAAYKRVELIGFVREFIVCVFRGGTTFDRIIAVPLSRFTVITALLGLLGYQPYSLPELMRTLQHKTIEIALAKPNRAHRAAEQPLLSVVDASLQNAPGGQTQWPPAEMPLPEYTSGGLLTGTGFAEIDYAPSNTTTGPTGSTGLTTPPPSPPIA